MEKLTRRSFIAGTAAASAALTAAAPAFADEAADGRTVETAVTNPTNGTLAAGYLNYFDWLGNKPSYAEGDVVSTVEADVVVVGGGNAGVCAALAAAEAGAKVAVVEKQDEESYSFLGHDIGTVNSSWVIEHGGQQIDEADFIQDWTRRNINRVNTSLTARFAHTSGAALDWILDHVSDDIKEQIGIFGLPLSDSYPGEISGFKCWSCAVHFQATDDGATDWPDAAGQLKEAAEAAGATWYFSHDAQVLTQDESGRVTGVIATDVDGNLVDFAASRGVVIAAGDYAGNPAMVFGLNDEYRNFVEERKLDWTQVVGMMGRTGRGQQLGCWAGGRIWPGPQASMGHANGAGCFGGIALPHFNCRGERFMNEGILGVWGGYYQELRQPKGVIYGVADANWREFVFKNAPEHVYPGTGGTNDGGFLSTLDEEIPNVAGTGAEGYKIRGCVTFCADTLEELAGYMYPDDTDAQAEFLAQVDRYNELCEKGTDEDFGKDSFLMEPISTPPFYASVSLHSENFGLGLVELGGLATDGDQRVLSADDRPIPGLWATGNSCGGRFVGSYHTPIAGISIGWAVSMGKLAGESAASAEA